MPEGLLLVVWSSIGLWVVGWVGLWVQRFCFAMGWVGLVQSFGGLGWVELKKLDPRTTLSLSVSVSLLSKGISMKLGLCELALVEGFSRSQVEGKGH